MSAAASSLGPDAALPPAARARQILAIVVLTGVSGCSLGIPLAVLPLFLHGDLGQNALITGAVLSAHAFSMLASRPLAGRIGDRAGVHRATALGLTLSAVSGLLTLVATSLPAYPLTSVAVLLLARLVLGVGMGLTNTGALSWAIAKAGVPEAARVISYNGILAYGALALTPPLGMLLAKAGGLWTIGAIVLLLNLAALAWSRRLPRVAVVPGAALSFLHVLRRIAPMGFALGLGAAGLAAIATFATLYFNARGWDHAAWAITAFGLSYIGLRVVCGNVISRYGGTAVAIASFAVEALGLLMMGFAPAAGMAMVGAALAGIGMSLIYPALGVEVVARVPASSRSSALGAFSLCLDLAMGLGGPLFGIVASLADFGAVFVCAGVMSGLGLGVAYRLHREFARRQGPAAAMP
ncbi:MFS transporter [Solimonas marina]|uniref:MFS transporter n=1 Tax=Solimonas marina TaxID=2714601 RepID=A0A970B4P3_9GAMM|nr:MFS transporter [Solimonas marina]NKF20843.1 MFS transporter [Solimonas marina]